MTQAFELEPLVGEFLIESEEDPGNREMLSRMPRAIMPAWTVPCAGDRYAIPQASLIGAYDGLEGFQKTLDTMPNLLVSDIDIPHMNGYEVCKTI